MKVIVDRIEKDNIIVEIEKGNTCSIPKLLIPAAQEGDVIKIEIDYQETEKRKKQIQNLMNQIFQDE